MACSLSAEELYLMHLMSCALRGTAPMALPAGATWDGVYNLALSNSVLTTCAFAVAKAPNADEDERKRWRDEVYKNCIRLVSFEDERKEVFAQMDEAGLAHLPVKGTVVCEAYPKPEMRWMCDNDFLFGHDLGDGKVRVANRDDAFALRKIMEGRGYEVEEFGKSNHDAYEKAPFYNFEPHLGLANVDHKWKDYYADPWARARRCADEGGLAYEFSREDHYIFHIVHMYKHFNLRGHGVRGIADEWALTQAWGQQMDRAYVEAELAKLHMAQFEADIRKVCEAAVGRDACGAVLRSEEDALAEHDADIIAYMMGCGTYGSMDNKTRNEIQRDARENGMLAARLHYVLHRLFPPLRVLKIYYPVLEKHPWLLPFVQLYRMTIRPLQKRGKVGAELDALSGKTGIEAPTAEKR